MCTSFYGVGLHALASIAAESAFYTLFDHLVNESEDILTFLVYSYFGDNVALAATLSSLSILQRYQTMICIVDMATYDRPALCNSLEIIAIQGMPIRKMVNTG